MSASCLPAVVLAAASAGASGGTPGDQGGGVAAGLELGRATIVYRAEAPQLERFAALELRRYLSQLGGKPIPIASDGRLPDGPAIAVGSAADALGAAGKVPESLGDQDQHFILRVVGQRLVVRGRGPVGTLYAVYELLETVGMGFYLGGDAYPSPPVSLRLPAGWSRPGKCVFKIRGSLPWYNFLNSPTTWNREDFKAFFDQMSKMKMNFVGFHTYDYEPFGAYRDEIGRLVMGSPLKTTLNYNWGMTGPLKTADFGWGTGRYFDREVFGSHATTDATSDEDAILRAERDLREALAYARSRGIHVCVGFELTGDPHDAANQERFRRRFADLLSEYPMIDYVWVWQTEGLGSGSGLPAPGTLGRVRMEQRRGVFEYLGEEKRIGEASRMTDYILLAYRILRQIAPDKRMIVSGWGGDKWMRFSDFYLGLDKVLPKDIIFAALDNIDPTAEPNVSKVYGQVSPDRERWPIPWFESDGGGTRRDQWGPQPNVKPFTALCRDAHKKGCQGILGIHWRTRAVEEVAAYVAQYAWKPTLTYEQFYDRFAKKCFGAGHAREMSAILRELESMGSRWSGMLGQVECGGFSWTSDGKRPDPKKLAVLDEIARRLETIRGEIVRGYPGDSLGRPTPPLTDLERLDYLLTTIGWLTRYDRAIERFLPGGPVEKALIDAARCRDESREVEARRAALRAWAHVRTSGFGDAIRTYGRKISNQGEFGVLATINVKAVVTYRQLVDRIAAFLPVGPPLELHYRRTQGATVLKWRPAAGAAKYRITAESERRRLIRIDGVDECSVSLAPQFFGRVHVRGISEDGVKGPRSETLLIPDPIGSGRGVGVWDSDPPPVVGVRPSTSFAAGDPIPVRIAVADGLPAETMKVHYRFADGKWQGPLAMRMAFGDTYRCRIPTPPAPAGSSPPWVEYWIMAEDVADRAALRFPVGSYTATIEPRPFARVWRPASDEPPVAGKDWVALVRVVVHGPEEGVSVRIDVDGGPKILAERVPHGSFRAIVPGGAIRDPELKIAAIVRRTRSGATENVRSPVWTFRTDAKAPSMPDKLRVTSPRKYQAMLEWDAAKDDTGVVAYKIEKDGKPVGETALTTWLDGRVAAGASLRYRVTAVDRAGRSGEPAEVAWQAPEWPPPEPPSDLKVGSGFGLVTLKWTAPEDDVTFRVLRAEAEDRAYTVISGKDPLAATAFVDHPPATGRDYWYQVVAVDPFEKRSRPSRSVKASAKPVPHEPILAADFDSPETTGKLQGGARLGKGKKGKGLDLTAGGWADFPDRSEYDDLVSFTLTLWIRPDTLDPMPVVVSHGLWEGPGMFLQFLNHKVRTYIGQGRVTDAGSLAVGTWQHIAVVRKGDLLSTYLDGRRIAQKRFTPAAVGAHRMPFRIGQYAHVQPDYQVKGVVDEVKLYLRALSEEELRKVMAR